MRKKEGSIINISSIFALIGCNCGIAPYHASKSGILSLTRALPIEWAPYNIRVNAILPGTVNTKMMEPVLKNPLYRHAIVKATPLKRIAEPYEIGGVAVFLASKASSFITGTYIVVDGGTIAK